MRSLQSSIKVWIVFILLLNTCISWAQEPNYQDSIAYYFKKANFEKAAYWSKQKINKYKEAGNDTFYCAALLDLCVIYRRMGNFPLAEATLLETLDITEKKLGNDNLSYAETIGELGSLYRDMGFYNKSEEAFKKALSIYRQKNKTSNIGYGINLNNLALLYQKTENFKAAEKLQLEALEIRKKQFGDTSKEYAVQLNNIAVLYYNLGNYEAAEPLYKKAINIYKKLGDTLGTTYRSLIANLGTLYVQLKKYNDAEENLLTGLRFAKQIYGKQGPEYGLALHELGALYRFKSDFISSEKYFKESLEVRAKALGANHADYLTTLSHLSELYIGMKDYKKADSVIKIVQQLSQDNFGKYNLLYLDNIVNKTSAYKKSGNKSMTISSLQEQQEIEKQLILNKLSFLTEKELLAYLNKRKETINSIYDVTSFTRTDSNIISSYNFLLLLKGIAVQNFTSLSRQMETSGDTTARRLWKAYKEIKAQLNRQLILPVTKRTTNVDSLSQAVNQKEKQLLDISEPYRDVNQKLSVTWQDVKRALNLKQAAIEFVRYRVLKIENDYEFHYAALLIRKQDAAPVFIDLCNEEDLLSAMNKFAYKNNTSSVTYKNNTAKTVYQLIWQPLEKYLANINGVYYSPDGLLHGLAFAAIPVSTSKLLIDRYQLLQLTSTRQIVTRDNVDKQEITASLFGGINYNSQRTDTSANADAYAYVYQQNHRNLADSFTYLPGTLQEINGIAKKLQAATAKVQLYTGTAASESAFRKACNEEKPAIIHFATHGFTLPDTVNQKNGSTPYTTSRNPLLRTGLVMAAGNKGWKGQNNIDEDDGILTGNEIAAMQLPNTELVVLSACETANGEVRGSEGVFGLQRAFKLAGVNYVMASLWQVPDKQTAEFMNVFYSNWLHGNTMQNAFYETQTTMRKKYSPYYWAGFTLVK